MPGAFFEFMKRLFLSCPQIIPTVTTIARVLYLCKDVETFGSGIRKIYSLCNTAGVEIKYENTDTDFKIEFSRIDRNKSPLSGQENGRINDHISGLEQAVLSCLRDDPGMTNAELIVKTGKSQRTITRVLAALKGKGLITRIGSNKTGYWQVKKYFLSSLLALALAPQGKDS